MTDKDTPTPRTDEAAIGFARLLVDQEKFSVTELVDAKFARQLECENAELRGQLEAERKVREESELKLSRYAPHDYYVQQREESIRKIADQHMLIAATEHDRRREQIRAEAAERRLAEVEQDARRYQELLSRYTTMLRIGEKLSVGIVFHALTDWEPDHFDNVPHKISAAIDAAIKESAEQEKDRGR